MTGRYRAGDVVIATMTDTDGRTVTAGVRVQRVCRLGCGCQRLTADRPGKIPAPSGVALLTGCANHDSQLEER